MNYLISEHNNTIYVCNVLFIPTIVQTAVAYIVLGFIMCPPIILAQLYVVLYLPYSKKMNNNLERQNCDQAHDVT